MLDKGVETDDLYERVKGDPDLESINRAFEKRLGSQKKSLRGEPPTVHKF
jgi:hypothetical protein